MKGSITSILALLALGLSSYSMAAGPQDSQNPKQQDSYSQQLLSSETLRSTPVLDPEQLPVGVVSQVFLDPLSGRVAYLQVKSNGFWGTLDQTALVPWRALHMQGGTDPRVILNVSASRLEGAPMNLQALQGRTQEEQLHQYYGVSPYWQGVLSQRPQVPDRPTENLQQPMLQGGKYLTGEEDQPKPPGPNLDLQK